MTYILITVSFVGRIAERSRRSDPLLVLSLTVAGIAAGMIPSWDPEFAWVLFAIIGVCLGPPGALIVSLPAEVLRSENRSEGMGLFYTFIYVGVAVLPPIAGLSRDLTNSAGAPLLFGGAMLLASLPFLGLFRYLQRRYRPDFA